MTQAGLLAADAGHSRLKWGWRDAEGTIQGLALPLDRPEEWARVAERVPPQGRWVIAGSNLPVRAAFADWVRGQGQACQLITDYRQLPITVALPKPERVGLDRLLAAVAVKLQGLCPAVVVDAGSAVTVNLVDAEGQFQGGAILPGYRFMARALRAGTTTLPEVAQPASLPSFPGQGTEEAIAAGITAAVVGGIESLVRRVQAVRPGVALVLTGGDAPWLRTLLTQDFRYEPWLTLQGLLWTAEALTE